MQSFKILSCGVIGLYTIVQIFLIIPQLSGPKVITVYKEISRDSNAYIKGYKAESTHVDQFNVKVQPNSFWDRLLFTKEEDNLLYDFFKVAAGLTFCLYAFNLQYNNFFSKKSTILFGMALYAIVLGYAAFDIGLTHTLDFYRDLYIAKGGDRSGRYDFCIKPDRASSSIRFLFYYWIPTMIMYLYRGAKKHYEGKPEEDWYNF